MVMVLAEQVYKAPLPTRWSLRQRLLNTDSQIVALMHGHISHKTKNYLSCCTVN